ncbi:MAG: hypothetical protein H6917_09480 [Novosphingobium sp.]|nr:hypothetical protein [Novosphingobium sp.]
MRRLTIPLTALVALTLSGCWVSEDPLIPDAAKDMPQLGSRYVELNSDGSEARLALIEVTDGEIHLTLEHGTESRQRYWLRFDRLYDDWYLLQAIPEDENPDMLAFFRLLKAQGQQWLEFAPGCGEDLAGIAGIERSGGDCSFSGYASLAAAATIEARKIDASNGNAGEFSGSYVPEQPR